MIFTEIGVRSIAGAARAPWDWQVSGRIDLTGQKRWYQAALRTFAARDWMKGLFWWQRYTDPTVGGHGRQLQPHGKPAEVVLRAWFKHRLR